MLATPALAVKKILGLVFLTVFLDMLGIGILIPVFPLLITPTSLFKVTPLGWSSAQSYIMAGWLMASFPLAQFFCTPILGKLSDNYGRRKILLLSLVGTLFGYVIFALGILSHNLPLLFMARILDGASGGNISLAQAIIGDISPAAARAKNFGLIGIALGIGFVFGPVVGGKLSDASLISWFNAATPFCFAALLSGLNLLLVFKFLPETTSVPLARASILLDREIGVPFAPDHTGDLETSILLAPDHPVAPVHPATMGHQVDQISVGAPATRVQGGHRILLYRITHGLTLALQNIVKLFSSRQLRKIIPPLFLFNAGFTLFTTFWGVILIEKYGLAPGGIGNFFAYLGVMIILAQGVVVRRLSGKITDYKVLRYSIVLTGICLLVYFLIPAQRVHWLYALPPLLALSIALTKAFSLALLTRLTPGSMRGEVMGINSSSNALAQAIPAIVAGYIASVQTTLAVLVGGVIVIAGGLLFCYLFRCGDGAATVVTPP